MTTSPYLKAHRLEDVIAAVQFLGQYSEYKCSVDRWTTKMASAPRSATSWKDVFTEHPEFFRTNSDGEVSLIWRRSLAKEGDERPPLGESSIIRMLEMALSLRDSAAELERHSETSNVEAQHWDEANRRAWWQLVVSVVTALLALVGALLAASIKASAP